MKTGLIVVALAALLPLTTIAAAAEPSTSLSTQSKDWVDLQTSGKQASGTPRPMPGEIADNAYQRYADSFKQPIPAEFKRQSADSSGNGTGK